MADEPVYITAEQFLEYRKRIARHVKRLEDLISDSFQAISDLEEKQNTLIDEATDHATRAERAVRRLKKDYDAHEHGEE